MTVQTASVNSHLVVRDDLLTWRWFDAFGPKVTKWFLDPYNVQLATDATITNYTVTAVGTSPITMVAGADGGALLLTTGGTEHNGVQFQPVTEGFRFAAPWPCYFGFNFSIDTAAQCDWFAGLSITDSSAATAVADGIYFWKVDASAVANFATISTAGGAVTSSIEAFTVVAGTTYTLEWFFDGSVVTGYVNGVSVGTLAWTATSFPKAEYLTPLIGVLTGATAVTVMTVNWARAIQIREA
jgi:hypothetical protein